MEKFIKTQDTELAEILRKQGFKELKPQGKFFVFINNSCAKFTVEQKKKVVFTNKMEV